MRRVYEAMTGWGTSIGSVLVGLSLATTLVVYAVRMEGGISHCTLAVDRLEKRLDCISDNVVKTREDVAKIQGQLQPVKPMQTALDGPR